MAQVQLATSTHDRDREALLRDFFDNLDKCTNKNDLTHGLHPYPAKFIPHIPRELIRAYSEAGQTVWDPMCGSGTTLVEAAVEGRSAIGTDINPIAVLASKAKTTPLSAGDRLELRSFSKALRNEAHRWKAGSAKALGLVPVFHNRDHWFDEHVATELAHAQALIGGLRSARSLTLARCVFSAVVVGVSNQESETRWRAVSKQIDPGAVLSTLATKLSSAIDRVEDFRGRASGPVRVERGDACRSHIADESVELVVTSPPYANSHDYYLYNKLRMFWLGYEVAPVQTSEIGSRNRHSDRREGIETYLDGMEKVLAEVNRVLVPGGVITVVVGDAVIRSEFFPMNDLLPPVARRQHLALEAEFSFDHRRFNRTFQRGFGARVTKATHVLVFRKH